MATAISVIPARVARCSPMLVARRGGREGRRFCFFGKNNDIKPKSSILPSSFVMNPSSLSTTATKRTMSTTITHLGAATLNEQTSKEPNKPPLPPFTRESAIEKVRMAEDAWNTQDPHKVKMAYTPDTMWRNRSNFIKGRDEVAKFLEGKWKRERNYKLIKELWAYEGNRIAARICYEFQNADGQWFRAHGNENWEFAPDGRMAHRHASINDVPIEASERKFTWEGHATSRPKDFPSLSELGL